jgi:hydrogenase/urease accessory protein HupE
MFEFTSGLIAMGFLVAGLFFLRYWRQTRDGLFAAFAAAFVLLSVNQTLLAFSRVPLEERSPLYLVRLLAFGIIIAAVLAKNVSGPRR